jgi:hypothetical protein
MMLEPISKGFLSWVYYHKVELLSAFFSVLIFLLAFFLIRDISQNRRASELLAQQALQQKKILEDQIRFNKFLIDSDGQTIGELRQQIVDQANSDRSELRRLEDALRAAGVRLPSQSVLEGSTPVIGASLSSTATPTAPQSGTVVTSPQPTGQGTRGHSFPNVCIAGICLFGDI